MSFLPEEGTFMRREAFGERIGIEGLLLAPIIAIAPLLQSVVPMVAIGTRLAVGAMMAALLALIILNPRQRVHIRGGYKFYIVIPFFLLIVWGMVSSIISLNDIRVAYIIQLIGLFFYILILSIIQMNRRTINAIMLFGALSGLILSLYGLEGFLTGEHTRAMGWFAGSNQFGGILLAQMFFPLYFICSKHTVCRCHHLVAFPIAFLMALAMLLSGSRSVVLSLLILLSMLLITRVRLRRQRLAMYGIAISLLLGAIYFAVVHYESLYALTARHEFLRVFSKPEVVLGGRISLWEHFLTKAVERPIVGFGFSSTLAVINGVTTHPHSLFLLMLYQGGIVGLSVLIWLLGGLMIYLRRYIHYPIGRLIFCLSVALILRDIWEITLLANNVSIVIIFWTSLVVAISGIYNDKKSLARERSHRSVKGKVIT